MSPENGIVVLDNNCYRELVSESAQRQFKRRAELLGLTPAPSLLNLAESLCAAPVHRKKLLSAMRGVRSQYPLLPWPFEMLRQSATEILKGVHTFDYESSGFEHLLDEPEDAVGDWSGTRAFLRSLEEQLSARFATQRQAIQRHIQQHGLRNSWEDARSFLTHWWDGDVPSAGLRWYWKQLGLPGQAPIEHLLRNEAWRLLLDAEGFAMFARCIVFEQTRKVGFADLIQLPYLSLRPHKRVLVTNDMPFHEAAGAILRGRYPNAQVVTLTNFMA